MVTFPNAGREGATSLRLPVRTPNKFSSGTLQLLCTSIGIYISNSEVKLIATKIQRGYLFEWGTEYRQRTEVCSVSIRQS